MVEPTDTQQSCVGIVKTQSKITCKNKTVTISHCSLCRRCCSAKGRLRCEPPYVSRRHVSSCNGRDGDRVVLCYIAKAPSSVLLSSGRTFDDISHWLDDQRLWGKCGTLSFCPASLTAACRFFLSLWTTGSPTT